MEQKPHQRLWAYRGLEFEVGEKLEGIERQGSWRKREYYDAYFCQICLEENIPVCAQRHGGKGHERPNDYD